MLGAARGKPSPTFQELLAWRRPPSPTRCWGPPPFSSASADRASRCQTALHLAALAGEHVRDLQTKHQDVRRCLVQAPLAGSIAEICRRSTKMSDGAAPGTAVREHVRKQHYRPL